MTGDVTGHYLPRASAYDKKKGQHSFLASSLCSVRTNNQIPWEARRRAGRRKACQSKRTRKWTEKEKNKETKKKEVDYVDSDQRWKNTLNSSDKIPLLGAIFQCYSAT